MRSHRLASVFSRRRNPLPG